MSNGNEADALDEIPGARPGDPPVAKNGPPKVI
jgi:hypothetical protein